MLNLIFCTANLCVPTFHQLRAQHLLCVRKDQQARPWGGDRWGLARKQVVQLQSSSGKDPQLLPGRVALGKSFGLTESRAPPVRQDSASYHRRLCFSTHSSDQGSGGACPHGA